MDPMLRACIGIDNRPRHDGGALSEEGDSAFKKSCILALPLLIQRSHTPLMPPEESKYHTTQSKNGSTAKDDDRRETIRRSQAWPIL